MRKGIPDLLNKCFSSTERYCHGGVLKGCSFCGCYILWNKLKKLLEGVSFM